MKIKHLYLYPLALLLVLAILIPQTGQVNAGPQTPGGQAKPAKISQQSNSQICYAIADDGGGPPGDDLLTQVDFLSGVETVIGSPGTEDMEAITFQAPTETLFGVDSDQLGTLSLSTGTFTPTSNSFGTADGATGTINVDDVDSLAFDPLTGILYGVNRIRKSVADVLVQISPDTGEIVHNAFGPGIDYVVVPDLDSLQDIDDISVDPVDGRMYAIQNDQGKGDHLITIDKQTGAVTDIGAVGVNDMEGLTVDPSGQLLGTTGKDGPTETKNRLWRIDKQTGKADIDTAKPLTAGTDYEGVSCLTSWPTAVEMIHFQVEAVHGRQVTLSWLLAAEINNFGFYLYRAGENNRLEAEEVAFIEPAGGSGENLYTYTDSVPTAGEWWYWLADVDTNEHETYHGPVAVVSMNQIYLPLTVTP